MLNISRFIIDKLVTLKSILWIFIHAKFKDPEFGCVSRASNDIRLPNSSLIMSTLNSFTHTKLQYAKMIRRHPQMNDTPTLHLQIFSIYWLGLPV